MDSTDVCLHKRIRTNLVNYNESILDAANNSICGLKTFTYIIFGLGKHIFYI